MESYLNCLGARTNKRRSRFAPLVAAAALLGAPAAGLNVASAARKPGSPRTLRIAGTAPGPFGQRWRSDDPLEQGSLSQPAFGKRDDQGADLFFTRASAGALNLWRVRLPLEDAPAPGDDEEIRRPSRPQVLDAVPLTQLEAPYFAASPAPTPDGRAVLCVTNAGLSAGDIAAGRSAIARLDLNNGQLSTLTDGTGADTSPAVSPDGRRFAWVSDREGFPSIYLRNLEGGAAERVSALARHPHWLDSDTLLFESTQPGTGGLYRVTLTPGARRAKPQILWKRAGITTASHNGRWLCVSTRAPGQDAAAPSRLYLLAPDGSGARSIGNTEGAGGPAFAPGDWAIVFDAPLTDPKAKSRRTLWLLPMLRTAPTASLTAVRPQRGQPVSSATVPLDVYGSVFTEGGAPDAVRLEWGAGEEPTQWQPLTVANEAANNTALARWAPPAPEGQYTFRLSVTDSEGDSSESLLTIALPLDIPPPAGSVPVFAILPPGQGPGTAQEVPQQAPATAAAPKPVPPQPAKPSAPRLAAAPGPGTAKPATATKPTAAPRALPAAPADNRIALSTVPRLPLPALPPAPGEKKPEPGPTPPNVRAPESASDPAPPAPKPQPAPKPTPTPKPAPAPKPTPAKKPTPRPAPKPAKDQAKPAPKAPAERRPGDAASLTISGVPISMKTGETAELEATIRNTGTNGWSNNSNAPVRLLIYWRDLKTGRRTRWNIRWLRADVPPGGSTKLSFELPAPPRPGKYQLRFCLVRVEGGSYTAPPISETTMPGEFGVASTTMDVE